MVSDAPGSRALVGYYSHSLDREAFDRIIPVVQSNGGGYVAEPQREGVKVGFGPPQRLTLLMDPKGSVKASVGILPARSISLPDVLYAPMLDKMETSFRVGPVLFPFVSAGSPQGGGFSLPLPAGYIGEWVFIGGGVPKDGTPVLPYDGKGRLADTRQFVGEGRLVFRIPRNQEGAKE
jgi:hypothetical protein